MSELKQTDIGEIGNYYGCLEVRTDGKKFEWSIGNYDGYFWEEISETLYNELMKHNESLKSKYR